MARRNSIGAPLLLCCLVLLGAGRANPARAAVDYARELKPLLRDRCFACHGALKQKSGLRLDSVELMRRGGKSGPALDPAHPDRSLILARVTAPDLADRMPPEHEGEPFTPAQVTLLRAWLDAGAPAPAGEKAENDPQDHWAFRPRTRPPVPSLPGNGWLRNPVDAFIARQHTDHGLVPQPEAPRAVLIRRLYLDLIGLPPSPAELDTLTSDPAEDWYERTVDRLLEDPRHGERWARHWMDIWRYSDPWGLGDQHRNSQKHIWHWRDWIIESLVADLPYDEMIRLMLAADESHPNDLRRLRATGFLARNYFLFNRNQWLDETVEHVGKGFLGLTFNCAKCHDHKYDPIAQPDYYRLRAFFEPYHARLDVLPGEPDVTRDALPRAYDRMLDSPTYRFVRGQENVPDKSVLMTPGVPALLAFRELDIHPVPLPLEAWQPERRSWVHENHLSIARTNLALARRKALEASARLASAPASPATNAIAEITADWHAAQLGVASAESELAGLERRVDAIRARWHGETSGSESHLAAVAAERRAAAAKASLAVAETELRLLRAAADKKEAVHKELAVAREKLAQASALAASAPSPTNAYTRLPGAYWTATRFLDSTRDDPEVEFAPTSTGRRTALAAWITDPRNPLTARVAVNHLWDRHLGSPLAPNVFDFGRKNPGPVYADLLDWLASELVDHGWSLRHVHRLIVLSTTYRMDSSVAGTDANAAKDPDNQRWWRRQPIRLEAQVVRDSLLAHAGRLDPAIGGPPVPAAEQSESRRRSLYFFHSNNERNAFLAAFDDATVKECYRREQSIVPQQALALLNVKMVHDAAPAIAARLASGAALEDAPFVRRAFSVLLGFAPGDSESNASLSALAAWRAADTATPSSNDVRARLVWALLNHNDFVTLR